MYYPKLENDWECQDASGKSYMRLYYNSIHTAYIHPIMNYCDIAWNCCGVSNSSSLERLQRRTAKIGSEMSDSDKALHYLKWSSLVNRRDNHVNELVKICIKGPCLQLFKNYFTFEISVHNRIAGQMNRLHLLRVRTDIAKNSFY